MNNYKRAAQQKERRGSIDIISSLRPDMVESIAKVAATHAPMAQDGAAEITSMKD
jgi:hypothetical protein